MFTNSTIVLRGCLHRNSPIYGRCRCRCRFQARFHNSSRFASSRHRDAELNEQRLAERAFDNRQSPPQQPTASIRLPEPDASTHSTVEAHSPVEPSGQSVGKQTEDLDHRLRSVEYHATRIFGHIDRPISKHLVALKRPGPQAVSDPQALGLGSAASPKWSFPPGWRTISPETEGISPTKHDEFRAFWWTYYKEVVSLWHEGGLPKARQHFDVHRQVAITFVGDRSLEELRDAWTAVLERNKLQLATIMLGCLVDSARRTLLMLSLDILFPRDWRHRCECLCFLDQAYRDEIDGDVYLQELFAQQIERVSRIWTWPSDTKRMPWYFLVLFLRHNSPEHIENIVDTIIENYQDISPRVILVIVDHFTKLGDTDRALEFLSRIPPDQREEHKVRILERCANLISIDTIDESDSVANFRALPRLVGLGLPMDFKVHNRILERALELGRPEVAWEVFRFMEARDICVEANGYLMLLKNSFEQNDREKLDAMMSSIHRHEDLYQYPYLVTYMMNIVRVVCTIDRKLSPETSVSHLLAIYDRAYDRTPLVKLGIVNALPPQHTLQKRLEEPPPAVLGFTIWAYVLCQRDERIVSALWFWIMHMIKQQDESILACAKHDVMWNGFIHFYARSRFFLRKAVYVVEAMIEHNLCMPTERTWSEVLCGFMKHGEEETAAKIWHMMVAREVQPTEKGWAFLLENYDQTRLADLVKQCIDERQMPEGMDKALGWPTANTAVENALTEAKAAQQASHGVAENEGVGGETEIEAGDAIPALAGRSVSQ
ncbi:hypothetical protein G647_05395 [Cladophialophora carrionii CBS 160.54]|uniref:Pentatricopeptide repeat domain-containing protein n=1 Tax=Cladophialophora carrionii CBS 160.54 TaxID=1279043 RepID=V9DBB9_9EURO|nr:uncharacterized protein G647_05395 [Cladophialophora carrionii CBS 160.54]ETI23593.1 hypothetical protein G647_05395 [Cladophialophora carrionii CBS 160.54]